MPSEESERGGEFLFENKRSWLYQHMRKNFQEEGHLSGRTEEGRRHPGLSSTAATGAAENTFCLFYFLTP